VDSRCAAIVSILSDISGLYPKVPPFLEDDPLPVALVEDIHDKELENLVEKSGVVFTIMQVKACHTDYEMAWAARESIKAAIYAASGSIGTTGQVIDGVNHDHDAQLYDDKLAVWQLITRFRIEWES